MGKRFDCEWDESSGDCVHFRKIILLRRCTSMNQYARGVEINKEYVPYLQYAPGEKPIEKDIYFCCMVSNAISLASWYRGPNSSPNECWDMASGTKLKTAGNIRKT
jgi:hypothetical protein